MTLQATAPTLSPAQKAWVTRRAKAAADLAALTQVAQPPSAPIDQPALIINRSTDADLIATLRVYREPEMIAVEEFRYVEIYLSDDPVMGSGLRAYIPLEMSAARVRLFNPVSLETMLISRKVFDDKHVPVPSRRFRRERIADGIRKRLALADQVNAKAGRELMNDGGAYAARAIALLTENGGRYA